MVRREIILLSPHRTLAESLPQPFVQVVQLLLQPCNVSLDTGTDGDGGGAAAVQTVVYVLNVHNCSHPQAEASRTCSETPS